VITNTLPVYAGRRRVAMNVDNVDLLTEHMVTLDTLLEEFTIAYGRFVFDHFL